MKSWSKCDITLREINNNHILTIISDSINQKNVAIKMIINIIGSDNLFPYIHPPTNTNNYIPHSHSIQTYNNTHFSPPPSLYSTQTYIPFNTPSNKNYSIPPVSNQQYSIPLPIPNKLVNDISKLEKENFELQNQINDMNNINKE